MTDNHLGTVDGAQLLMGIDARLVLGEIDGVHHLTDVVIESACSYQLAFGINLIGNLCGQVSYLDGVLEGAWGHLTHLTEQGFVHIRQFDQRDVRDKAKCLLDEIE